MKSYYIWSPTELVATKTLLNLLEERRLRNVACK